MLAEIFAVYPSSKRILNATDGKDYIAFSLSDLVPLISTVVTDDTVTFTLELTDRDGNVFEQDLSFYSPVKNQ